MLLPDVTRRVREPELMDSGALDRARHARALAALATVNALSLAAARVWGEVRAQYAARCGGQVRLVDVACGGGDVIVSLLRRARRHGVALEAVGCDVSPVAVEHARALADRHGVNARFVTLDALADDLPAEADVVSCSLFLHHLSETDAERLLARMAAAARGALLVQDLVRSRMGLALAWGTLRVVSRSDVAHVDGPRSVRAAFSVPEVTRLCRRAGLTGARIRRCWPERFELRWSPR